jgi:hypothetical protein
MHTEQIAILSAKLTTWVRVGIPLGESEPTCAGVPMSKALSDLLDESKPVDKVDKQTVSLAKAVLDAVAAARR